MKSMFPRYASKIKQIPGAQNSDRSYQQIKW